MVLLTILVLGLLDRQVLRILILQTKIYLLGVATYWVVYVNLFFWEEFSKKGMRNLNNQTAQLVGTSWD